MKKTNNFMEMFTKNTITLDTINAKSFEISTPTPHGYKLTTKLDSNDNFTNHIPENPAIQADFLTTPLKKKSIFAQRVEREFINDVDKYIEGAKGNKFIFKLV